MSLFIILSLKISIFFFKYHLNLYFLRYFAHEVDDNGFNINHWLHYIDLFSPFLDLFKFSFILKRKQHRAITLTKSTFLNHSWHFFYNRSQYLWRLPKLPHSLHSSYSHSLISFFQKNLTPKDHSTTYALHSPLHQIIFLVRDVLYYFCIC